MSGDPFTSPGAVDTFPRIGRGGHLRNAQGQALIDVGGQLRIATGGSDLDPFADPYAGDPLWGQLGTHVHDICDLADCGVPLNDAVVADGEALGLSAEKQQWVYDSWLLFLAAHGFTVVVDHIEQVVANPVWMVASNVDRVLERDGDWFIGDIKSAKAVDKRGYLLQLACYADGDTRPYDPTDRTYTEWDSRIREDVGYILHLPVGQLRMATDPADYPAWSLVEVDLAAGRHIWQAICAAKSIDPRPAFSTIACPDRTANASVDGPAGDAPPLTSPARLDEQRARWAGLSPADRQAFTAYATAHAVDMTNADDIRRAIDAIIGFDDVAPVAPAAVTVAPEPAPAKVAPDEGDMIGDAEVEAVGRHYAALDDAARAWVSAAGAHIRLSPAHGGVASVRRFELLRALIALAEDGRDNDAELRAVATVVVGDHQAWTTPNCADLLATLDVANATRFASVVDATNNGHMAKRYTTDNRPVWSPSVAA